MARSYVSSQRSSGVFDFAAALADAARSWQGEHGVDGVLDAVVHSAVTIVPGVRWASVSVLGPKRTLATAAQTDQLVGAIDRAQCRLGQGPGVDAALQLVTCRCTDMQAEPRWSAFRQLAVKTGLASMLSCPLVVPGECLGALTLASDRVEAFDEHTERLSGLFAAHAAIALVTCRGEQQLREALSSRDLIGQAKGILMQRHRASAGEAFAALVRTSQDTNVRLRDVARHVVEDAERTARSARRRRPELGSESGGLEYVARNVAS